MRKKGLCRVPTPQVSGAWRFFRSTPLIDPSEHKPKLRAIACFYPTRRLYKRLETKMGRKRVISEHQVLDAAERVVVTKGAARLTIEAVASQAGISKATVLYYYKTKKALIQAVVDRIVSADVAANEAAIDSLQGEKDAAIRGRILAASEMMTDEFSWRDPGSAITASGHFRTSHLGTQLAHPPIAEAVRPLDLQVRSGLHTGEM